MGDVHLHAGSPARLGEDLARLVRAWTASNPAAAVVFNGDLFDLDRVAGESDYGLGEARAARRLEGILDAFPDLESALRRHASGAGVLVFLAGNHDAELLLPKVSGVIRRRLGPPAAAQRASVLVLERIALPGVVVEHGHQADPDSAFHPNMPEALAQSRLSAFPLASLITRLLLCRIPRFELSGDHYRAPAAVVARVLRDYRLSAVAMIVRFPFAAMHIVALSVAARARFRREPKAPDVSMASPWTVLRRLYLDRYLATAACLPVAVLALSGWFGWWPWLGLSLLGAALVLPPPRRKHFHLRDVRRGEELAHRLLRQGARLVVFGHTHRAFVATNGTGVFANHGAFTGAHGQADSRTASTLGDLVPAVRTSVECSFLIVRARDLQCVLATTSTEG